MSSDLEGANQSAGSARRFWIIVTVAIAALVVVFSGLLLANVQRGPQLLDVEFNAKQSVERPGQRLVLRVDQVIDGVAAEDVSISPDVPVKLSVEPAALTLQFDELLAYGTSYEVRVPVSSVAAGTRSELTYSFRTPDAVAYLLRRTAAGTRPDAVDEIVRTTVGGAEEVVARAGHIQEFAVSGSSLAVVTNDDADNDVLIVKPVTGSGPERVVAENAVISRLRAASVAGMFGFVSFSSKAEETGDPAQLRVYDPASPEKLIDVTGINGKPLDPQTWAFVPGTTSIIAQGEDATVYLIDPLNRTPPRQLGAHVVFHGFIRNSPTVLFEDPGGYVSINLTTGETRTFPTFIRSGGRKALQKIFALSGDASYVGLEVSYEADRFEYRAVTITGGKIRPLFVPARDVWIPAACLAPNGEYLALELADRLAQPDGNSSKPGYVGATTVLVNTESGEVSRPVPGFATHWCN